VRAGCTRPTRGRAAATDGGVEGGFTLVEVLISIAILSVAVFVVVGGMNVYAMAPKSRSRRRRTGAMALFCGLAAVLALALAAPAAGAKTTSRRRTGVAATAGIRSIKVTFTAPANNGGAKVDNYRATCTSSQGGKPRSHEGRKSPIKVNGLTSGKTHTRTVSAHNKAGRGPESGPSNSVTLPDVPGKPSINSVTPGKHRITVAFTAPASDGGSPITGSRTKCTTTAGRPRAIHTTARSRRSSSRASAPARACTVSAKNKVRPRPRLRSFGPGHAD